MPRSPFEGGRSHPDPSHGGVWSPSQDTIDTPCTKRLIKEKNKGIKSRALLEKFLEITMSESNGNKKEEQ